MQLRLDNRHTVTSYLINVPSRFGDPAKLYYQAIRGSSSMPIAVTELSENGRKLRTTEIVGVTNCKGRLKCA